MNKFTWTFLKFRNKDDHLPEKPTAAQTANIGWEQEELGGIYLCQPSQEHEHKTCNSLQEHNERAKDAAAKKSTQAMQHMPPCFGDYTSWHSASEINCFPLMLTQQWD